MAFNDEETTFKFDFKLPDGLNKSEQKEIKKEVGTFLVESILDKIGQQVSPVSGGRFKKELSPEYAKEKGTNIANLELNGDMLSALEFKITETGVEVGIWDSDQAIKSFAHNTGYEGHPYLESTKLKRQFIPRGDEKLKQDILKGARNIIQEYLDANQDW